jgi:hypothetical protein
MIRPPSIIDPFTGKKRVRETLPGGQSTMTPWRRAGVHYSTNGHPSRM